MPFKTSSSPRRTTSTTDVGKYAVIAGPIFLAEYWLRVFPCHRTIFTNTSCPLSPRTPIAADPNNKFRELLIKAKESGLTWDDTFSHFTSAPETTAAISQKDFAAGLQKLSSNTSCDVTQVGIKGNGGRLSVLEILDDECAPNVTATLFRRFSRAPLCLRLCGQGDGLS